MIPSKAMIPSLSTDDLDFLPAYSHQRQAGKLSPTPAVSAEVFSASVARDFAQQERRERSESSCTTAKNSRPGGVKNVDAGPPDEASEDHRRRGSCGGKFFSRGREKICGKLFPKIDRGHDSLLSTDDSPTPVKSRKDSWKQITSFAEMIPSIGP